jgi:nitrous oxide reductase accessory protein NosL
MRALLSLICAVLIGACSPQEKSGPVEVRWDKEVCQRCSMGIGDDRFAAQVRGGPDGKVFKFDEIGCAVIWLEQQDWAHAAGTEIWVSDFNDRQWIDARQARYVQVMHSPMGYGLGAVAGVEPGAIDFEAAIVHIHGVENNEHRQGQPRHKHETPGQAE